MSRLRCWAVIVPLILSASCGAPRPATTDPAAACTEDRLAECEAALIVASDDEMAPLIAAYAAARHEPAYDALWQALRRDSDRALLVGEIAGAPETLPRVPLPPPPVQVSLDDLLLALGRAAGRSHLIVAEGAAIRQLFPTDPLASAALGLPPVVAGDPRRVAADVALAAQLEDVFAKASDFDYVGAARGGDELSRMLESRGREDEAALRARYALSLLGSSGIALTVAEEDSADDAETASEDDADGGFARKSTPYASLLALILSTDDRAAAYDRHAPAIAPALTPERATALERMWGHEDGCGAPFVPPLATLDDLLFAAPFVRALDRDAAPGQAPARGKLPLQDWLPRYDELVELVASHGLAYSHASLLVEERGTVRGLSPEGTASYTKVTTLVSAHMEALGKLAAAEPARFQTLGAVNLAYLPGVLGDRALNEAVTRLAQRSVALKISAANEADTLWEAVITAFAIGMGYPPSLQGPHFTALRQGLANKLAGGLIRRGGWSVAALAAGNAGLGALLGDADALAAAAPQVAAALRADAGSFPGVARLVTSAIRYAELAGTGALDADVSNTNMFPESRGRARAALEEAVVGLASEGPASPPEQAYAQLIAGMADELIVAGLADVTGSDEEKVSCDGDDSVGPALRDAFDRLQRKRRALLDHAAHRSKDPGPWLRRARLLALALSDGLDLLDQRDGRLAFRIPTEEARQTVRRALEGWAEEAGIDVATSLYLVGRGAVGGSKASSAMVDDGLRALRGLAEMFDSGGAGLFATLAALGAKTGRDGDDLSGLLTAAASGAYAAEAMDQGDLLLMLHLGVALMSSAPVDDAAVELATARRRPVRLPLLLYGRVAHDGADPEPIVTAMREAASGGCAPPDPRTMIAARRAIHGFKRGERQAALESLERILADAERDGLTVPRQVFRYQQLQGDKIFKVEQSISLGEHLLTASGSFEVGLGLQTRPRYGSEFDVELAPTGTRDAQAEAARYYAHLAGVAAVYAFAAGEREIAVRHATRAVGAWVNGVKLGADRVPAGSETVSWARDATATLAVAAQQAADAGEPMLAGDLWTLAQAALGRGAEDATVDETLDPLPPHLRGIPEVASLAKRARAQLETVAAKLDCTTRKGDVADFQRVGCERYPTAIALRITDALPYLPRLQGRAAIGRPGCATWVALDDFLAAYDAGRYEPDKLNRVVEVAVGAGRHHVAATVLTRQRVPQHCNPDLVRHARVLSKRHDLGVHLRTDLLSVATNCSAPSDLADDLAALDALTRRHADPSRGFEVLLFAARLAAEKDIWRPLYSMTRREGFIDRWQALNPELATAALLLHHAAAISLGEPLGAEDTLPYYRLICTTFPSPRRGPICNAVALLRGGGPADDKKRVAKETVTQFVTDALQGAPQRPPP